VSIELVCWAFIGAGIGRISADFVRAMWPDWSRWLAVPAAICIMTVVLVVLRSVGVARP
jgi:hypothetical protein